jgi:MGT family glycosyltransferase
MIPMQRMNFLFTTWEGGGNVTPALEAVRKVVERGHRVRVMSEECNRKEAEAAGAAFVAWKRAPNRTDRMPASDRCRDWAQATPQEGLLSVIRDLWCGPSQGYAEDVVEELQREAADLVVTSEMLMGVMAGCESVGQKYAVLYPSLRLYPMPGLPPFGPGFAPAKNDEERAMHEHVRKMSEGLFDSGLPALNSAREAVGLEPLEHLMEQLDSAQVELVATSPAFDFPADVLPENIRYVGPVLADPRWAKRWQSPWAATDARPLVSVGFSTTFQNHAGVLQKVIDALEPLPVRVLVTLGGSIEADALRAAKNCVLVESAPHSEVMREASLVVTHGGHGTVMQALAARVPMLVIPHGRDQADNAIRVTERGAGLSLPPDASVEAIRVACLRLLEEDSFRAAAKTLGDRVAADAASTTVVEELEAAVRAGAEVAA